MLPWGRGGWGWGWGVGVGDVQFSLQCDVFQFLTMQFLADVFEKNKDLDVLEDV